MENRLTNPKIRETITQVLKPDSRLWTAPTQTTTPAEANAEKPHAPPKPPAPTLNQTLLIDLAERGDKTLISALFANPTLREKFFIAAAENAYTFLSNRFRFFIEENQIHNSYTDYANRIGIGVGIAATKKFLRDSDDVVLHFPYKDCVLQGGQRSDESTDARYAKTPDGKYQKQTAARKEIFFNQVLAHDEIDRLLDEKALVNWQRYTAKGAQPVKQLKRDATGALTENLLIKGNNLIALHSLKAQFAGAVKLIYIDPPYNTGKDSFKYNDKFNHSTWLTFMKNRLEIARDLMREDGVIFVQCDDNEQAYLKVLMDEVFGRENFVIDVIWNSRKSISNDAIISVNHNHTLVYSKSFPQIKEKLRIGNFRLDVADTGYANPDNDPRGDWKSVHIEISSVNISESLRYEIIDDSHNKYYPQDNSCWRFSKDTFQKMKKEGKIIFDPNGKRKPRYKQFKNETLRTLSSVWSDVGTTTNGTKHLKQLFGSAVFNNPKPESLIQRIIELATLPGEIVLDFCLGSGTTATTAHKMGRQYIGIEQMDYIKPIAVERMKKVIAGEQGGISKAIDWKGGGEFVYCELAQWNETAKTQILACKTLPQLVKLFATISKKYFLNYNLNIKEFEEKVITEPEFKALPLDQQKKMCLTMLDLNQLYVHRSEMADSAYNISASDQTLTEQFYQSP